MTDTPRACLTINDKEIEISAEMTVLRAAKLAGINIPTLCDRPHLTPYDGCRLCVVEVTGVDSLQPSCTLSVSHGMVVQTDTPRTRKARLEVLTRLFSQRNHFCMFCQVSGGGCELQNAAYGESMTHWPIQPNWQPYPTDASHPHFVLDHNRCILCRRCIRACGELVGNFTLDNREQGVDGMVVADLGVPLGESSCISCGTCVQVCPTGAFIDRFSAYRGRGTEVERTKTICAGCSVGCGLNLVVRDNQLLRIEGDWNASVNQGLLCQVGRFLPLYEERERVLTPLIRQNGALKAATWTEALDIVSIRLKALIGKEGHGLAALASTRLSAEALSFFKHLFAEKIGGEMVTSIEEGVPTALSGQVAQTIGHPFEGNLNALRAADCVVAVGVNLVGNHHQVAGFSIKRALSQGAKLISIDPYDNGMHELADYALRPKQGRDYGLLLGIIAGIVELGLAKVELANLPNLALYYPAVVSQTIGIDAETIRAVGRVIASAKTPTFVYGKGVTRAESPTVLNALLDLARLVGALDGDHSAVLSLKGEANSLAAYLYGLNKTFRVDDQQVVYLALGDDYASRRLIRRLEGVSFIAVQASYFSPVTEMADVVLPTGIWVEQEGHFLNLEGRLQKAHKGLVPPAGIRSNVEILQAIAARLGLTLENNWRSELHRRISPNAIFE